MPTIEYNGLTFEWNDTKFELVNPKFIQNLRQRQAERHKTDDNQLDQSDWQAMFDNDVRQMLIKHNNQQDKERLNSMIRLLFA